jgi:predicted RNA binding protein YcfA (HicA-like mRNA interferase family)
MTERLPALRAKDVVRALERAGFVKSRTSGSHCRLIHAGDPTRKVTVPITPRTSSAGHYAPSWLSQD